MPEDFTFNVKAFWLSTGHQTPAKALPTDIAEELAPHFEEKKNIYYKDLPENLSKELWKRFELGVRPLRKAGKLMALHFQFAPWATPSPESKRHLEECVGRLADYQLAFEFRNRIWYDGDHDEESLAMEREMGVARVVVDECRRGAIRGGSPSAPRLLVCSRPLDAQGIHASGLRQRSPRRFRQAEGDSELEHTLCPASLVPCAPT